MLHHQVATSLLLALVAAPCVSGQSLVVPAANATARGTGGLNTLTRDSGNARTYMLGIDAAQHLAGLPIGAVITGLSFRSSITTSNPASWPAVDATWASYEIQVGSAIPVASWTGAFASNFSSPPQLVRSGPMLITTGTYSNNTGLSAPTPNTWGEFYFDFQTPYVYAGGDLGIYFTHGGSSIVGALFLDYVASNAANGFVAYSQTVFQGTAGASANACIPRLHYGYGAGCPGTSGTAPVLVSAGDLLGGGTARLAVGNAVAGQLGLFLLGSGRTQLPLFGSCNLLVLPLETLPFTLDANGRFALSQPVAPGILGTLDIQALTVDPGAPNGLVLANGVGFTAR
ncbi:MAG: hypothetical protein IPN34_08965 [Planctomycetes bacterium]|nr:hypothetical protein [Planctomycetota bacterium]